MKTVLVTGASTGIGLELCKLFAEDKYKVILTARNEEPLRQRARELSERYQAETEIFACDLAQEGASERLVAQLQEKKLVVDVLVNNAGFGAAGRFVNIDLEIERQMINLNVLALTELTRLMLPDMIKRGFGHILNIASTAGFVPGPGMAVYYATKAYVISLSEALANELTGTGVGLTVVCPGPTATEFQKRAGMSESRLFNVVKPMTAERVARLAFRAMKRGDIMVVPGGTNKLVAATARIVPRGLVPHMVRKINEPL